MKFNPDVHKRESIRLKGYDYSKAGIYFTTICTHNKGALFGEIIDGKMNLNCIGEIVKEEILKTNKIRKNIKIDEYIIMPNHIHFIIEIVDNAGHVQRSPTKEKFGKATSNSTLTIVRLMKSSVTNSVFL